MGIHVSKVVEMFLGKVEGFWSKLFFAVKSWFFDEYYVPVSEGELTDIVTKWKQTLLPKLVYTPETFDCDDFASYFKAWATKKAGKNAFAICLGEVFFKGGKGYHAWNGVLVVSAKEKELKILYVEPQTAEIFEKTSVDGWTYKLKAVVY
ncbi:MAG: hypothetical protein DRO23_10090 [Thermoprotei archaeon]|nr:MAG: hypothetical protein DRO23_10090 [Thermoprotei archaeon]